jgi:hypothetical protein
MAVAHARASLGRIRVGLSPMCDAPHVFVVLVRLDYPDRNVEAAAIAAS